MWGKLNSINGQSKRLIGILIVTDDEVTAFMFSLFVEKENFHGNEEQIRQLLGICKSDDEFFIIRHTLKNLLILSQSKLGMVVEKLVEELKVLAKKSQSLAIVAMAWDEGADSSQMLLQLIKPRFAGIKNIKFFNSVPNFIAKSRFKQHDNFALVDDFSGTGKTVLNRLKYIQNCAAQAGHNLDPFVGILFGMPNALNAIQAAGVEVKFVYQCTPGISGHFLEGEREKYIKTMKRIEEELCQEIDGVPLPSLGNGEAEALFCVETWNAPNSNFPVLWWPLCKNMNPRKTILSRFEL